MMTWPATLPQRMNIEGYQEGLGDGRLRSQTDAGIAKGRRRWSKVPKPLSGTMTMTEAQRGILEAFVRDSLNGGVSPFVFPAQRAGAGTWIVKIAESLPQWTALQGMSWRVQLDLVILP